MRHRRPARVIQRGRSENGMSGVTWLRFFLSGSIIAGGMVLASCSSSDPAETQGHELRTEVRRDQDCANTAWKQTHLGLWYSICRPNVAE
jgi:hypothetical protein